MRHSRDHARDHARDHSDSHDCSRWMDGLRDAVRRIEQGAAATLAQQIALSCIPSPTGEEAARRAEVRRRLEASGFANTVGAHLGEDGTGNLIARLQPPVDTMHTPPEERAPIVCMAHLDTVFSASAPLEPQQDGSVVACPGIGDNGRGLTALVHLAQQFLHADVRQHMRRPIVFVATVGEEGEGNLRGARAFFDGCESSARADSNNTCGIASVVVLDGPGDATIVHHAVASRRLRITLTGPGGHTWIDRSAPNPIHAAAHAIAAIARFGSSLPRSSSATVTRMGGGESLTSIAEQAWFDVDLRALSDVSLAHVTSEVRRIVHGSSASCALNITTLGERPGGMIARDHPLAALAADMTAWCGLEPVSAMASTDANIPLSRGVPAITIGAGGRGGGAHTAAEWYDDTHGARGLVRALGILSMLSAN